MNPTLRINKKHYGAWLLAAALMTFAPLAFAQDPADADFQERVCKRVENRMFPTRILERVNERLSRRFGFVCPQGNSPPRLSFDSAARDRFMKDLYQDILRQYPDEEYFHGRSEAENAFRTTIEKMGFGTLHQQPAASTTVEYRNEQAGISINVPYNPQWVSSRYELPAFEHISDRKFEFGPIYYEWHGRYLPRFGSVTVTPARNSDAALEELEGSKELGWIEQEPVLIDTGDLQYVQYTDMYPEAPEQNVIEVFGQQYNVVIRSILDAGDTKHRAQIIPMVESIRFTPKE